MAKEIWDIRLKRSESTGYMGLGLWKGGTCGGEREGVAVESEG